MTDQEIYKDAMKKMTDMFAQKCTVIEYQSEQISMLRNCMIGLLGIVDKQILSDEEDQVAQRGHNMIDALYHTL